jgi:hypothetical protein
MTPRLLRFAYTCEFLLALVAIFTAWSEIGGQAALDLMHWAWKAGLGFGLAAAVVGFTAALLSDEPFWTVRAARWLTLMIILMLLAGAVTHFYMLQEDTGDPEETGSITMRLPLSWSASSLS